jgi:hypothetical protein
VQGLVLFHDPAVLVGAIDDLGQIREQVADISVGDDHLLQCCKKAPEDGLLTF